MEIIFEFVAELIGDALVETIKNNHVSLYFRIPLFILFSLLVFAIIILLGFIGFKLLKSNLIGSIFFFLLAFIFLGFYLYFLYKLFRKSK